MALFTTPWSVERVTFLCLAYFGEEDKRTIEALSSLSIVSRRGGGGGGGRINYTGITMCEVGKY